VKGNKVLQAFTHRTCLLIQIPIENLPLEGEPNLLREMIGVDATIQEIIDVGAFICSSQQIV
jgi:hypothetical protein